MDGIKDGTIVDFVDGSNVGEDDGSVELRIVGAVEVGFEGEKVDKTVGTDVGTYDGVYIGAIDGSEELP